MFRIFEVLWKDNIKWQWNYIWHWTVSWSYRSSFYLAFLSLQISHIFQLQIANLKKVPFPETDKN